MNDAEIAHRCARRERSAREELVRAHLDVVSRAVRRVLGATGSLARQGRGQDTPRQNGIERDVSKTGRPGRVRPRARGECTPE